MTLVSPRGWQNGNASPDREIHWSIFTTFRNTYILLEILWNVYTFNRYFLKSCNRIFTSVYYKIQWTMYVRHGILFRHCVSLVTSQPVHSTDVSSFAHFFLPRRPPRNSFKYIYFDTFKRTTCWIEPFFSFLGQRRRRRGSLVNVERHLPARCHNLWGWTGSRVTIR